MKWLRVLGLSTILALIVNFPAYGLDIQDDDGFTVGTDLVEPIAGMLDDTSPDSVDEGDAGLLRMSADRKLYTVLSQAASELFATIRDLAANDALNVSVVDANGDQITSFGGSGGTSHSDDAAFTIGSASSITPMGAIADDTTPDSVDEGDAGVPRMTLTRKLYSVISDNNTEQHAEVDASGHFQVDIAADSVGIGGGTQFAEDAAHTTGDKGTVALGVRKATPADLSGADGDYEPFQIDNGRLWVSATIDAAIPAGTNAIGKLAANSGVDIGDVDVTSVVPGTGATNLGKAEDAAHASADTGVAVLAVRKATPADLSGADGDYEPLQIDNGRLWASATIDAALPAGTNAIGKLAANSGVDIGDVDVTSLPGVAGDVAHDAADSGNPLKVGGRAQEPTAAPDEVADNDRVDALFDRNGRQAVWAGSDYKFADINDAVSGDNTIIAAGGAGKRIAIWSVIAVSDGTVDVRFEDGAGGTAFTGQIPLQAREGFTYSAGGLVPLWVGSANTLFNMELSANVTVNGSVSYTLIDD